MLNYNVWCRDFGRRRRRRKRRRSRRRKRRKRRRWRRMSYSINTSISFICTQSVRSMRNVPVVPAGVISLKCFTTSSLFEHLAFIAKQRTNFLVSGSGSAKDSCSRFSLSRFTTSLGSHDSCKMDSRNWWPPGRASAFSSFAGKKKNYCCFRFSGKKNIYYDITKVL